MNGITRTQGAVPYISQQTLQKKQGKKDSVKTEDQQKQKKSSLLQIGTEKSNENKNKSSLPKTEDTPGQLAVKLANAKTPLDIQEVMAKAMRALMSLKNLQSSAEGKERTKLNLQIRRMEKVMSRSRMKIRHLRREEDLERKQHAAEKAENEQEAHAMYKELKQRRTKRRAEESRYAQKELAKDMKESQEFLAYEGFSANTSAMMDFSAMPVVKEASVDISV